MYIDPEHVPGILFLAIFGCIILAVVTRAFGPPKRFRGTIKSIRKVTQTKGFEYYPMGDYPVTMMEIQLEGTEDTFYGFIDGVNFPQASQLSVGTFLEFSEGAGAVVSAYKQTVTKTRNGAFTVSTFSPKHSEIIRISFPTRDLPKAN